MQASGIRMYFVLLWSDRWGKGCGRGFSGGCCSLKWARWSLGVGIKLVDGIFICMLDRNCNGVDDYLQF